MSKVFVVMLSDFGEGGVDSVWHSEKLASERADEQNKILEDYYSKRSMYARWWVCEADLQEK